MHGGTRPECLDLEIRHNQSLSIHVVQTRLLESRVCDRWNGYRAYETGYTSVQKTLLSLT